MQLPKRRASDRADNAERRMGDRRHQDEGVGAVRFPGWPEQKIQFLTRYLFLILGVIFFNFSSAFQPTWLSLTQINSIFTIYFLVNSAAFMHARAMPDCVSRYRVTMWVDIALATVCVINDPYVIPPSLLVFIMVVLGNGMRYGMRLFAEALTISFAGAMGALSLRSTAGEFSFSPGLIFLNLFGGIILIYAYLLMSRIEVSRRTLEKQSNIDTLTGLMNRRALLERAQSLFDSLGPHETVVVMFADLNKFKSINDTHGHAVGDEVLRGFAGILRECMRGSDIAARFGGDEFVLLLPNTSLAEARTVAERLRTEIAAWSQRRQVEVGVTVGMGEAPTHGRDLEDLLEKVDQAMYRAKVAPDLIGVIE